MSVDDEASIPVGEPSLPIAATSRRHNSSLVLGTASLEALDHDFHWNCTSVTYVVDIPETTQDNGKPYVILKDKILQPSSPLRHPTNNVKFCLLISLTLLLLC